MRLVWTKNHNSNRVRDGGPVGTIELEQIWRVTVRHGDNPPERQDFDREDMARHRVDFLKAKLGGTWEGVNGQD